MLHCILYLPYFYRDHAQATHQEYIRLSKHLKTLTLDLEKTSYQIRQKLKFLIKRGICFYCVQTAKQALSIYEQYLNGDYFLIFPGDFQGTPNGVSL